MNFSKTPRLVILTQTARRLLLVLLGFYYIWGLSSCSMIRSQISTEADKRIDVTIAYQNQEWTGEFPENLSVRDVLTQKQVPFTEQDMIEPGLNTIISPEMVIRVTHVTTEEKISRKTIPFASRIIRNETLPEGETYVIQTGKNGLTDITTLSTFEDGILASQITSNQQVIEEAVPEILMIGAQASYAPIQIPGKIVYISNGNAWLMEGTTENRTPLVTSGDLDGNILDLSSDGDWLLFSRKTRDDEINSLWMLNIDNWEAEPVALRVSNVVHYAEWLPGNTRRVLYSTVTPQESAPGWKANNDLRLRVVGNGGMLITDEAIIEANNEGLFSWWGTEFRLNQDGRTVAYATPGAIGIIDRLTGEKKQLLSILPYEQTRSDWAWVPGFDWSADGQSLAFSYHGDVSGMVQSYDPAAFNIATIDINSGEIEEILAESGLFSYPVFSPSFSDSRSEIAYLQAISPVQSESNRYRIMIMEEDGQNRRVVFPLNEEGYINPQKLQWAPVDTSATSWIAFIEQGNLWLVNPFTGIYNQITIDQSVSGFIWE